MLQDADALDLASLRRRYESGALRPSQTVARVLERIARRGEDPAWIHRFSRDVLQARAAELERRGPQGLPLYGIPFAIKDNIDAAGHPTTAACRPFSYVAKESASVVERLLAAGAILVGKTNLDQFATGLVGVRSPYGIPANTFDPDYVSGGSSSGSAVTVAAGLVSFSLGTDTAGSGRVPAAFNNLAGLKPTRGLLSARGVVPACRSLDCVSIFALTAADAARVLRVARGFDARAPLSRPGAAAARCLRRSAGARPAAQLRRLPVGRAARGPARVLRQSRYAAPVRQLPHPDFRAGRTAGDDRFRAVPRNRAPALRRALGRGTLRRDPRVHRAPARGAAPGHARDHRRRHAPQRDRKSTSLNS